MPRVPSKADPAIDPAQSAGFDYVLPPELIAQRPALERDGARMLRVRRGAKTVAEHCWIRDLPEFLDRGDLVVRNRSRVFPARLRGRRAPGGGKVEVLLLHEVAGEGPRWRALARPARRLNVGQQLAFEGAHDPVVSLEAEVVGKEEGSIVLAFPPGTDVLRAVAAIGEMPLPPYIERPHGPTPDDHERYQTVFARESGSVAAPTAGLHLTDALFRRLEERGVGVADLVLHVGPATFLAGRPGRSALAVEPESYIVPHETVDAIKSCQGRVVAVGTTTTRALESAARAGWPQGLQRTNLVLHPGETFEVVEGLLTNFHLPRSSLLALVAGFAGSDVAIAAYRTAVAARYRFYSYGDAMLVL